MTQQKEITRVQELIYEMKVEQVMVKDVITVEPDTPMSDLRSLLRDKRISGVPVVEGDRVVGLVSIEDFIKTLSDGNMNCLVKDQMTKNVKIIYNTDRLVHAVREFDRWGFGRFPVLDRKSRKLVGIITKGNIIQRLLNKLEIDYHAEETQRFQTSHFFESIITDKAKLTLQYDIIGKDFNRAGEASSNLKKSLKTMGIPQQIIRRVAIATYEAEMNVVIYADSGSLTVRVTQESIVVEVVDSGPGIEDINKALEPGFSTADDWIRDLGFGAGMGLNNIQKCADEMNLESTVQKGTDLEFIVNLNGEGKDETI
ncbi:MAG: CBS domain-containing protein [Candidatus Marinimicrobia bacterium]|nr:CBS domain-containing protein [Candidatus Neomarinimicrobiota bacterium]